MSPTRRIGLIVPSSNTTMEMEIPAMLRSIPGLGGSFTFHSARMRMKHVTPEELKSMDDASVQCAAELADARVDVLAYACLVAIMAQGIGYHRRSQVRLEAAVRENHGGNSPVISSAGALVEALHHLGAKRVAVVAPYMKPLTKLVCDYIEAEGIEVQDALSLEVSDNLEVGRLNPENLKEYATKVNTKGVDALILSACVQMPSLPAIQPVQDSFDIPVLSASIATVWKILKSLDLPTQVPNAGRLLA